MNAKGPNVPANEISYTDFYIKYEHKFLRNMYSKEGLETSKELKRLEPYFEVFDRFWTIVTLLESIITNSGTFRETSKEKLSNFIEEPCAGAKNYHEITEQIKETEIRQFDLKIPKSFQQLYAFVYSCLIEFPRSNIEYETVTTLNCTRNAYGIIKVKAHLHHSGEILGYVHDFWNWKVRGNKTEFSCIAHNFLGFDLYFFIRGYTAMTWNSKKIKYLRYGSDKDKLC